MTKKEIELQNKLNGCHETFRGKIYRLANIGGIPVLDVYAMWRTYANRCEFSDQSPLLWEFVQWYEKELGGNRQAITEAVL